MAAPAPSTWGAGGNAEVWLEPSNDWIYPHVRAVTSRLIELVRTRSGKDPLVDRALRSLILLCQRMANATPETDDELLGEGLVELDEPPLLDMATDG